MTDERSRPSAPCPSGLKTPGRRFWRQVVAAYLFRPDELILLETACKTLDVIAEIDAAMVGEPLTVRGSMGQLREHPLLSEARQQRGVLARMLAQLKLPDTDAGYAAIRAGARSVQARSAARSRWSQHYGDRPVRGA